MTKKMRMIIIQTLWLGAAALLTAAGLGTLIFGQGAAPAVWAGVMILLSGGLQCGLSQLMHRNVFGDRSFMSKGLLAVAVGAALLFRGIINQEVLRVVVSMMTLMCGVHLFTAALAMRTDRISGRWALLAIAAVEIILGAAGFLRVEILGVLAAPITGISLLYEGLAIGYTWYIGKQWMNKVEAAA